MIRPVLKGARSGPNAATTREQFTGLTDCCRALVVAWGVGAFFFKPPPVSFHPGMETHQYFSLTTRLCSVMIPVQLPSILYDIPTLCGTFYSLHRPPPYSLWYLSFSLSSPSLLFVVPFILSIIPLPALCGTFHSLYHPPPDAVWYLPFSLSPPSLLSVVPSLLSVITTLPYSFPQTCNSISRTTRFTLSVVATAVGTMTSVDLFGLDSTSGKLSPEPAPQIPGEVAFNYSDLFFLAGRPGLRSGGMHHGYGNRCV